ncbi:MAG: hypothetical protein ACREFR_06035 [Limisphaerales bacterium]
MRFKRGIPIFALLLSNALLLSFCGCVTTPHGNIVTVSGPNWRVQQGQALWTPRKGAPQFGGDLVIATANGRAFVQFSKGPLTIVTAQLTPTHWLIRFPKKGQAWEGRRPAPTRTLWLYLANALAGKRLPRSLHFQHEPDGNWRLENSKTGEILEGFISS